MSDFQKGLNNIIAATRRELAARGLKNSSVSYHFQDTGRGDATIGIGAPGKTAETKIPRKDVDDSHQGVPVSVQIQIKSLVSEFEGSGNG
jgi:hypothetical protein